MSKQLMLSASVSVLAMLGFALIGNVAAADELGAGAMRLRAVASACSSIVAGEVLPVLQPTLQ